MRVDGAVLRLHLDPLLQDGRTASVEMPPEALPKALGDALAEVRGYLPAVTVPALDDTGGCDLPELLASVVLDLAAWQLTLAYYGPVPPDSGEPVMLRYARSRKVLLDLAAGRATLPPVEPEGQSQPGQGVDAVNAAWHRGDVVTAPGLPPNGSGFYGGYLTGAYGPGYGWGGW